MKINCTCNKVQSIFIPTIGFLHDWQRPKGSRYYILQKWKNISISKRLLLNTPGRLIEKYVKLIEKYVKEE